VGFMKLINVFPPTAHKVFLRTDPMINAEIRNQTIKNLNLYKNCTEEELTDRIRQLGLEWDTERALQAKAGVLLLISSLLGTKIGRYAFLLTGVIGIFILQHALQGWCPTLPFARKWGIRTADEIYGEKTVLKMMRGDFAEQNSSVEEMLNVAEKQ